MFVSIWNRHYNSVQFVRSSSCSFLYEEPIGVIKIEPYLLRRGRCVPKILSFVSWMYDDEGH